MIWLYNGYIMKLSKGGIMNVNIRIPDEVHEELTKYKTNQKPHMSLNAIIVEAILERLEENKDIQKGITQIDMEALKRDR